MAYTNIYSPIKPPTEIMKPLFTLALITLALNIALGQNNTAKYDSTRNFLGKDAYQYTGQDLFLKGKPADPAEMRSFGYENFVKDYTFVEKEISDIGKNTYKPNKEGSNTDYDAVAEHYFKVLDVIRDPQAEADAFEHGKIFFLKLKDKSSGDVVYFKYDTTGRNTFPFVVSGYMEKKKKMAVGQQFVFADAVFTGSKDVNTGKPITIVTGDRWKCTDILVDHKYYNLCLLVQNTGGEKANIMVESVYGLHPSGSVYTLDEADKNRARWGSDFDVILKGNVKTGFTKIMCSLSWANPTILTTPTPPPAEASNGFIKITTTSTSTNTAS